jgi:hypothetical protein
VEAWALAILLLVTFVYFSQAGGANQNSRFALTRAVTEAGTFRIDRWASTTFDIATLGGHYYSDKAPGLGLLAVPAHALYVRAFGAPTHAEAVRAALHWATSGSVSLASALAGGLFYLIVLGRGYSRGTAAFVTLGWLLATPAFAYSTLFYGHQLAAALVVAAVGIIELGRNARRQAIRGALLGTTLGLLVATEYPTAVIVPLLLAYARPQRNRRLLFGCIAGLAVTLALLGGYHQRCFGSPFGAGYLALQAPEFAQTMATGWLGFRFPALHAVNALLFGEARGLLPAAPWLLVAGVGAVLLFRRREHAQLALSVVGFGVTLLLVSAFARWDGGAAFGPRHLGYALPLLVLLTAEPVERVVQLRAVPRLASAVLLGSLVAASHFLCLAAVAVLPEFPEQAVWVPFGDEVLEADPRHPLTQFVLPLFLDGRLSVKALGADGRFSVTYLAPPGHENDAYNLGELWCGLRGTSSLLPLAGIWLGAAALTVALGRRQRQPRTP